MSENEFRISDELLLKVQTESKEAHKHKIGNTEFLHYEMSDTPTKAALEILLKAQKDIIDQAWDLFGKSENISEMLDIVGSALYTVNMTYEPNMKTLRQWHSTMWSGNDLSDDTIAKKMADINATLSELLERPVDITGLTEEQMDALIDEAMAKGIISDLKDLNNRLWGTGE